MAEFFYNGFSGLDLSTEQTAQSQVSFLRCNNFVLNRKFGALLKRGGSKHYTISGNCWGIGGYSVASASLSFPSGYVPITHYRNGSVSSFYSYDWVNDDVTAIDLGANTSFGAGGIASFCQTGSMLAILAGKPAKWSSITGDIERLGGDAPTAALTSAAGIAGALTGTFRYVYTYYDASNGWESSPSPISTEVTVSSKKIDLSVIGGSPARDGTWTKRIYRTQLTNEEPFYYVTEISSATTTYTDNIGDESLGVEAPDIGDQSPPPTTSYLGESHVGRFWIVSGNSVYYSNEYVNSTNALEYYSEARKFSYNQNITGIKSCPRLGGLLIFRPPGFGIDIIRGNNETEFRSEELYREEGTHFGQSISVKNDLVAYWGASGPQVLVNGRIQENFNQRVANLLRGYEYHDYNEAIFVWSVWHEESQQFLFGFSAGDSASTLWSQVGSNLVINWEDSITGDLATWEEV